MLEKIDKKKESDDQLDVMQAANTHIFSQMPVP